MTQNKRRASSGPFRFLFSAAVSVGFLFAVACTSRSFSEQKASISKGTSAALFLPPKISDPSLLTDKYAGPKDLESYPIDQDLFVQVEQLFGSPSKLYTNMLDSTGKPRGSFSGGYNDFYKVPQDVLGYEKLLLAAKVVDSKRGAPAKFAAGSVLEILRRNRKEFSLLVEGRQSNTPNLLGESAMLNSNSEVSDSKLQHIVDPTRPFSMTQCLNYDPRDYNDIKWHYYCAIPAVFRACHRVNVGRFFQTQQHEVKKDFKSGKLNEEELAGTLAKLRREDENLVQSFCLNPSAKTHPFHDEMEKVLAQMDSAYSFPPGTIARLFQLFYKSQEDPVSGVNMYDYIMSSGVYSFDFAQQQAVLNAYYGEMKPLSGEGVGGVTSAPGLAFDPDLESDCSLFREKRKQSETASAGAPTSCNPAYLRTQAFFVEPKGAR